ncbi:MAG TPA: cell wall hydrolase, partial [Deltaproteobacteria bacterium]|nr:cell wall hydrolase [Deltaproteobacteria bacterium]
MKKTLAAVAVLFCMSLPLENAIAGELPACLHLGKSPTVRSVIEAGRIAEEEVLARLVYAESLSTGYADDQAVYEAIAWGVMNRVRLSRAFPSKARIYGSGIKGVIFKEGQFNPAVSKRSRFSKEFLCPSDKARWRMAELAALKALAGSGNPFIETPWEKEHGLSLPPGSRGILLSWAGGSLSRLDEAIERVSVFSEGRTLTTAELAGLLHPSRQSLRRS